MIVIRMDGNSSMELIEETVKVAQTKGFDVMLKSNNGQIIIALLGVGLLRVSPENFFGIDGIISVENDGKLFYSDFNSFCEAWDFFSKIKQKNN